MLKKHMVKLLAVAACAMLGMASVSCSGGGDDETSGTNYLSASTTLHPQAFLNGSEILVMTLVGSEEFRHIKTLTIECDPVEGESNTTTANVTLKFADYIGKHKAKVTMETDGASPVLKLQFEPIGSAESSAASSTVKQALGLTSVSDLGNTALNLVMAWTMSNGEAALNSSYASCTDTSEDAYVGPTFYYHASTGYYPDKYMDVDEWMGRYMEGNFVTSTEKNPKQ